MALIEAARAKDAIAVKAQIAAGADLNASCYGSTALQWAAENGDLPSLRALIEAGADPDQGAHAYTPATALTLAASKDHTDCIRFLIATGADVNAKDNGGRTAMGFAPRKATSSVSRRSSPLRLT